jgi:hypothetical protein
MQQLALGLIKADNLFYLEKSLVNDTVNHLDSIGLRNEMDTALLEWYLIGQADYCTIARYEFFS